MNGREKIPCSVEILTRNSERTLERCLESVKDFAEIIILDGVSTDRTRDIAGRYGARIVKQYETDEPLQRIADFSEVRNKGLRLASEDWFMYIDSDEYLSSEAAEEIRAIVASPDLLAHAWWQPRKYVLNGKIIDCASTYPNRQIRFFHRSWVMGFIKPIHERIEIRSGARIGTLRNVEYVPLESLEELRSRWQRYSEKELDLYRDAGTARIAKAIARNSALFAFYSLRYARNVMLCRGERMPFSYEWARHSLTLYVAGRLIVQFFTR